MLLFPAANGDRTPSDIADSLFTSISGALTAMSGLSVRAEVSSELVYSWESTMEASHTLPRRVGAVRRTGIPPAVLIALNAGEIETATLAEWLAVDLQALLGIFAAESGVYDRIPATLKDPSFAGKGITERLKLLGRFIIDASDANFDLYKHAAVHRSDVVRQWAAYALLNRSDLALHQRLLLTLPFARDSNMSVREVAWMTFRPFLANNLGLGLQLLKPLSTDFDYRIRRFAIEVCRPRSVWGSHLKELKREPALAVELVNNVRSDPAKYVQDAAANWLNDASKSQPRWVLSWCEQWRLDAGSSCRRIIRRALRSLAKDPVFQCAVGNIVRYP
jgi:3-methyladenine DNA glycosylase AlkC